MLELSMIALTSMATAAGSVTLTRTHPFERLRERANGWLDCTYCTSHWVGALLVLPAVSGPYQFVVGWLATVCGSAILAGFVIGEE